MRLDITWKSSMDQLSWFFLTMDKSTCLGWYSTLIWNLWSWLTVAKRSIGTNIQTNNLPKCCPRCGEFAPWKEGPGFNPSPRYCQKGKTNASRFLSIEGFVFLRSLFIPRSKSAIDFKASCRSVFNTKYISEKKEKHRKILNSLLRNRPYISID